MTQVGRIGPGGLPARRVARASSGFALPDPGAPAAQATGAAGAVSALLALQEAPPRRASAAEEGARRAGQALDELRGLQLDLLRGRRDPARLKRLAELGASLGPTGDAALDALLAEVALRARVELARDRDEGASRGAAASAI